MTKENKITRDQVLWVFVGVGLLVICAAWLTVFAMSGTISTGLKQEVIVEISSQSEHFASENKTPTPTPTQEINPDGSVTGTYDPILGEWSGGHPSEEKMRADRVAAGFPAEGINESTRNSP